jgi:hypothetical protein
MIRSTRLPLTGGFSVGLSLPVYEAPDTPIPVGWALVHQPADQRQ